MNDPILQKLLADNGWITEEQVAVLEGVETCTVVSRRSRGHMPPFYKVGRTVVYDADAIADRIRANRIVNPATARASADLLGAA